MLFYSRDSRRYLRVGEEGKEEVKIDLLELNFHLGARMDDGFVWTAV